jgi:23S rRNA G2069 N7-methylase RlmK/C1962 C5-methylase RlmI
MPYLNYTGGAEDFIQYAIKKEMKFDVIIFDPPWNERKSKEFYGGRYIGKFTKLKNDLHKLLDYGGYIISAGFEIVYFGRKRNFTLEETLVVDSKGEIRPFFISTERYVKRKVNNKLSKYI